MKIFSKNNQLQNLHYGQAFHHAAATPLSSLLLSLELAREHQLMAQSPYVQQAISSAYHLKELFELPKNKSKTFSVNHSIAIATNLLKRSFPQVIINSHCKFPKTTTLKGNKFYFQEAIICTLKNAIESYVGLNAGQNRIIMITGHQNSSQLSLSFTDGGKGMNWLEQSLIFAEGFTTKTQGSGLGLIWVKRVVEDHFAGKIKIQSKKNHGTTMTWTLPL